MNDDARYERLFAEVLTDLAPSRAPERLKTDIKQTTSRSRPRPRWLAVVKEPPMRLSSALAVGSPTARVAAILAATLLIAAAVAGAGSAGSRLLAADGTIVVDQSGDGHFTTIAEAVAAAQDGDTILVRPGTYVEAVVIDTDIELKGDGPVEEIVIMAPEDGPTAPAETSTQEDPYAILLRDSNATLSGLTFEGEPSEVFASGGSPTLEHLRFIGTGYPYDGSTTLPGGSSIVVNNGSTATIRDNTITSGGPIGVFDGSEPLIEGNTLSGGPHIWGGFGDGAVIRGNIIEGAFVRAIGSFDDSSPLFEGNVISGTQTGIDSWAGSPTVRGNRIEGSGLMAIQVLKTGQPVIAENTLVDNATAISWSAETGAIEGNNVTGGRAGIVVQTGAPDVRDNSVEGVETRGLTIGFGASPTLSGNTSCDNGENLMVADGATPTIDDSNEICEDAPIE